MDRKNNSFRLPSAHGNAYQMWIGSKQIRRIMVGTTLVWPNNYVDGYANSLSFKSSYNVIKDYTLSGASLYEKHEVDPGGGFAYVNIVAREDSNWHQVTSYMKIVNGSISGVSRSASSSSDVTYTYTQVSGDDATSSNVQRYAYVGTQQWCQSARPYDYRLDISIPPNNTPNTRSSYLFLYQYRDEFNNLCTIPNGISNPVVWVYQNANIMYYTHYAWATSASASSVTSSIDLTSIKYNETSKTVYLFLEFGISVDGGNTIYWNAAASSSTGNQSSTLPSNISDYIKVDRTGSDFTISVGTLTNSNFIPITLTMSSNTSANSNGGKSATLFSDGISNTSGNATSPATYTDNSTSTSKVKVYYGVGVADRTSTMTVSCTYPNHTF